MKDWKEFWLEKSQHLEQQHLNPDTHGVIIEYVQKALDQQKQEIVDIVKQHEGDMCYASQNIINKIKEL